MTVNVAGLDPSTTCTGYAAPDGTLHSCRPPRTEEDPARKRHQVRNLLERTIRLHPPMPDLIVIEGYSVNTPNRIMLIRLGELGGMIRDLLLVAGIRYVEVPPTSLKKFATGNGRAEKSAMCAAAASRILAADPCAPGPANDDEADAFHLRRMGRVALGLEAVGGDHEYPAIEACGVNW